MPDAPHRRTPSPTPHPREAVRFARKRAGPLYGVKAVGSFLPGLTRKAFEKYGFSTATLIMDWGAIVGAGLAAYAAPERLKWPRGSVREEEAGSARQGATLVLRVDGGRSLDVQHNSQQIIQRINAYFGYAAIKDLRIVQAPVAENGAPAPTRPSAPPRLQEEVAHIADPGLRDALARLGAGIRAGR